MAFDDHASGGRPSRTSIGRGHRRYLEYLNRVLEVNVAERWARVEPGIGSMN